MGRDINDFVLDSKGHCFLCLDKISVKHGRESVPPQCPKYSLHYLSRYLKMDMRKVFHDRDQIPPHLLAKVNDSRLKVELCEECVNLIDQFSENYRKLEKAEIQLGSCLRQIQAKCLNANKTGKTEHFKRSTNSEAHLNFGGSGGELEILEILRAEAVQKSRNMLRAIRPRVKFCNLTRKGIRRRQLKYKSSNNIPKEEKDASESSNMEVYSGSQLDLNDIITEIPAAHFSPDDENEDCPSDDSNHHSEAMMSEDDVDDKQLKEHNNRTRNSPENSSFSPVVTKKGGKNIDVRQHVAVTNINPETGKYKCGICAKEFSNKLVSQRHYESIHLKVRFKCVTCGKQFTDRSNFNRHQKCVHVGIRYACKVCNKSFRQVGGLRHHQRMTDCGTKRD